MTSHSAGSLDSGGVRPYVGPMTTATVTARGLINDARTISETLAQHGDALPEAARTALQARLAALHAAIPAAVAAAEAAQREDGAKVARAIRNVYIR